MKLCIETTQTCDAGELRTLLIDAAAQLIGTDAILLEAKLPWDGHPLLFADADCHPVLLSFDTGQGQAALLSGLKSAEQLAAALPWVNQVYEALGQRMQPVRLVVVSPDYPPGAEAVLRGCPHLELFRYRTLGINGETGVWFEALNASALRTDTVGYPTAMPSADGAGPATRKLQKVGTGPAPRPDDSKPATTATEALPSLTPEEERFFQQL